MKRTFLFLCTVTTVGFCVFNITPHPANLPAQTAMAAIESATKTSPTTNSTVAEQSLMESMLELIKSPFLWIVLIGAGAAWGIYTYLSQRDSSPTYRRGGSSRRFSDDETEYVSPLRTKTLLQEENTQENRQDRSMDYMRSTLDEIHQRVCELLENALLNQKPFAELTQTVKQNHEVLRLTAKESSSQYRAMSDQLSHTVSALPSKEFLDKRLSVLEAGFARLEQSVGDLARLQRHILLEQIWAENEKIAAVFLEKQGRILGDTDPELFDQDFGKIEAFFNVLSSIQKRPGVEEHVKSEINDFRKLIGKKPWIALILLSRARKNFAHFQTSAEKLDFDSMTAEECLKKMREMAKTRLALENELNHLRSDAPINLSDLPQNEFTLAVMKCLDALLPKIRSESRPEYLPLEQLAREMGIHVMPITPEQTRFKDNYHESRSNEQREDLESGVITKIIRHGFTSAKGEILQPAWVVVNSR